MIDADKRKAVWLLHRQAMGEVVQPLKFGQ